MRTLILGGSGLYQRITPALAHPTQRPPHKLRVAWTRASLQRTPNQLYIPCRRSVLQCCTVQPHKAQVPPPGRCRSGPHRRPCTPPPRVGLYRYRRGTAGARWTAMGSGGPGGTARTDCRCCMFRTRRGGKGSVSVRRGQVGFIMI